MRHPFDGIIIPEAAVEPFPSKGSYATHPSRRSVLRRLLAAPAALLWLALARPARGQGVIPAQPPSPLPQDGPEKAARYGLYFIVPEDVRTLSSKRRKDLNVLGKLLRGWPTRDELRYTASFSAWLLPDEAERLRDEEGIRAVYDKRVDDVVTAGTAQRGDFRVLVPLAPNGWQTKPPRGTYLSARQVARLWSREFSRFGNVRVGMVPGQTELLQVAFGNGPVPERVLETIRNHAQVSLIQWAPRPTTLAVGEEGGVVPPGPTTRAVGEEGGRPPGVTTFAIGEEGGPPPGPTTLAVGEEGGRPPVEGPTTGAPSPRPGR